MVVAVSLVFLLGMAALAIDLSSFWKDQRQAQAAADAAALGAAQDLPSNAGSATTDAKTLGAENDPGSTVTETTPYSGSTSKVMVKVTASSPGFFGHVFGFPSANVSATAVAGPSSTASYDAIFASDTTCSSKGVNSIGISVTGSSATIAGGVISNGYLNTSGSSDVLGPTWSGGPNKCAPNVSGSGDSFNGASAPTPTTTSQSWPIDYTSEGPTSSICTNSNPTTGTVTLSGTVAPGVYCVPNGTISVTSTTTATGVTLIANAFSFTGTGFSITPASTANGLAIYQTGSSELDLTQSGLLDGGTIFAPNALVRVSGGAAETGFVEAKDVWVSGTSFTFTGTGPSTLGVSGITLLG